MTVIDFLGSGRRRARGTKPVWDLVRALLVLAGFSGLAGYLYWREDEVVVGMADVVDGDTLRISGKVIRLKGLDAPELQQTCNRGNATYRCGETARSALARAADDGVMTCRIVGRDRYRRALGWCLVREQDVGALLVSKGLAVAYGGYGPEEARARADKAGLWAGSFQMPEDWRREHRPPERS